MNQLISVEENKTLAFLFQQKKELEKKTKELDSIIDSIKENLFIAMKQNDMRIYATPYVDGISFKVNLVSRMKKEVDLSKAVTELLLAGINPNEYMIFDDSRFMKDFPGNKAIKEEIGSEYLTIKEERK